MSQISPREAVLEIGVQIKNAFKSMNASAQATATTSSVRSTEPEVKEPISQFTSQPNEVPEAKQKRVQIADLKKEIGPERAYINETLKNKLSEFGLPPNTQLSLGQSITGEIYLQGPIVNSQLERMSFDINNDQHFVNAYRAVSKQNPTLDYVDNVTKLSQAYGAKNQIFESLLSENKEFNQLKDITLRYQSLASQTDVNEPVQVRENA